MGDLFPRGGGGGGLGYHSPPSAEGMNDWSYTSNIPHAFMGYVGTTLLHCSIKSTLIFSLPPHIIETFYSFMHTDPKHEKSILFENA
jgi:hypothetical protein